MTCFSMTDAEILARRVLAASRVEAGNAAIVARALVAADADGIPSHGLSRLPAYAWQARAGKVDGFARPVIEQVGSGTLSIDAGGGFAYPAILRAIAEGTRLAARTGIAAAGIRRSHHAGVLGHHVETAARQGLIAIAFANTPAAIAPWGGHAPVFGTNPIAFAAPRGDIPPLVVDLSLSQAARGKIVAARREGRAIPEGWALDGEGRPTTDPDAALAGTLLPAGGVKGTQLALMVEILAAALLGANFGFEASSLLDAEGDPPGIGQTFIFLSPGHFGATNFAARLETLIGAIERQPGTRLPGQRRFALRARAEAEGIDIPPGLLDEIERAAGIPEGEHLP